MLYRLISFAAAGVLVSAFAGSAAAHHCTQYNQYNQAGAIARVRAPSFLMARHAAITAATSSTPGDAPAACAR